MAKKDYYQVLGLPRTASQDDIKKEYRKLAVRYHPDKNPDHAEEAAETFKLISEAYGTLSHPEKRLQYDTYGHQDLDEQQQRTPYSVSNPRRARHYYQNLYTVDLGIADPYSGLFDSLDSVFSHVIPTREGSDYWGSPLLQGGNNFNTFHSLFADIFRTDSADFAHTSRGRRRASQSATGSFASTAQRGSTGPNLRSHTQRTVISRNADGRRVTRIETIIYDEHEKPFFVTAKRKISLGLEQQRFGSSPITLKSPRPVLSIPKWSPRMAQQHQQTFVEETVADVDNDVAGDAEAEVQARLAQHRQRHHRRQHRMPFYPHHRPSYSVDVHQPTRHSSSASAHDVIYHTVPGHVPNSWTSQRRQRVESRHTPPVDNELHSSFLNDPFFTSFFR